jgi:hypothetical protein
MTSQDFSSRLDSWQPLKDLSDNFQGHFRNMFETWQILGNQLENSNPSINELISLHQTLQTNAFLQTMIETLHFRSASHNSFCVKGRRPQICQMGDDLNFF